MGKDVAFGRAQQGRRGFGVDAFGQGAGGGRAIGERGEDRSFAAEAVVDQPVEAGGRIRDRCAVAGVEDGPVPRLQTGTAGHEIGQIAIRRRHERAGPAHHVVGGEADVALAKRDVVADMAGRVDHLQRPAVAIDVVTVGHHLVGNKVGVDTFTAACEPALREALHHLAAPGLRVAIGQHRRAGGLGQRASKWGMVQMRVGDDDVADGLAGRQCVKDCLQMVRVDRARIDHRQFPFAHKIGVGAAVGHRRRVRSHDAAQAGGEMFGKADGRVKIVGRLHRLPLRFAAR